MFVLNWQFVHNSFVTGTDAQAVRATCVKFAYNIIIKKKIMRNTKQLQQQNCRLIYILVLLLLDV